MFLKASYIGLSTASLLLLLLEAPRASLLTSAPERGKVERKAAAAADAGHGTVRGGGGYFVLLGGYHGGK